MSLAYPDVNLLIDAVWRQARGKPLPVMNPATGEQIGTVPTAQPQDLDEAVAAAERGFRTWSAMTPFDRSRLMLIAADLLRERADHIAPIMTMEQGKPLADARAEVLTSSDIIAWFAEEGRRIYGRVIPSRTPGVQQIVMKEPVGPVAAFTPWNFPILQAVRKVAIALGAGCSIVLKGPEETPASCAEMIRAFVDAGLPPGVVGLVFGVPSDISKYLIAHPVVRKISFTGSTAVGKQLAALAGQHMKRVTMELGGHAPAIVCQDADIDLAIKILSENKFRNAGQICVAPSRFLVHESLYRTFVDGMTSAAEKVKVGNGLDPETRMGPLANPRRVQAMEALIQDAVARGASLKAGGKRIGNSGNFFQATVLADVPRDARIMNEEPFGPVAPIVPFRDVGDAIGEANRLPFGLASYVYTRSAVTAGEFGRKLENGIVSINQHARSVPEAPFGGIKDSGFGSEGGSEAFESYLNTKFLSQVGVS